MNPGGLIDVRHHVYKQVIILRALIRDHARPGDMVKTYRVDAFTSHETAHINTLHTLLENMCMRGQVDVLFGACESFSLPAV